MYVVSTWVADGLKIQDSSRALTSPMLAPAPWVACSWVVANPINYWEALWVCDGNAVYLTQDFGATFAVITGNLQVRRCVLSVFKPLLFFWNLWIYYFGMSCVVSIFFVRLPGVCVCVCVARW